MKHLDHTQRDSAEVLHVAKIDTDLVSLVLKQVHAIDPLHQQINVLFTLKSSVKLREVPRATQMLHALHLNQDVPLVVQMLNLLLTNKS